MQMDCRKGRYRVRLAETDADLLACQHLRHQCFFKMDGRDHDRFDPAWQHLMVMDACDALVATLRFQICQPSLASQGYAGQFYNLDSFGTLKGPLLEIGRFCVSPTIPDVAVLRSIWAALTQIVDKQEIALVFGCASFPGIAVGMHRGSFRQLYACHQPPKPFGSFRKDPAAVGFETLPASQAAETAMPPLLRTYLAMGGWVSDHAVPDPEMQTLHVLMGLEPAKVPPARAKALRALV